MTVDKLSSYNYGITGLRSFFDSNFNKPTGLQTKINPNEEHFFYITMLIHLPDQQGSKGGALHEQELSWKNKIFFVKLA